MHGVRRTLQNIAIFLLAITSLFYVIEPYLQRLTPFRQVRNHIYSALLNSYGLDIAMHRVLAFTLGFLGVLLAFKLHQRVRFAWIIEMMIQSALLVLNVMRPQGFVPALILVQAFILLVLGVTFKDFSRSSDRLSIFRAFILAAGASAVVLLNAVLSLFLHRSQFAGVQTFNDALVRSLRFIFFMDASYSGYTTKVGLVYANSLIAISWICIVGSVLLILKPLIYDQISGMHDRKRVHSLVRNYGQNPMGYLALEQDKRYFFGEAVPGVAAYTVAGGVFVCCGDMICHEADATVFLAEIMDFARKNGWELLFLNITDRLIPVYQQFGFGVTKFGEDACFDLATYSLRGNKVAKVRAAINRANKAGIIVEEYRPAPRRDAGVEQEMQEVSRQWFKGKGAELSFMISGLGLDNPLERRYFYARDPEGKMLGFVVFLPYDGASAYLADITRRLPGAPPGVMEKIIFEAFMRLRADGVQWGNLGLCPLVNVRSEDQETLTTRFFEFVYERVTGIYDFKALHHAKKKFAPTAWVTRYVAFSPKPFSPRFVYAMIAVQSPKGIRGVLSRRSKAAHKQVEAASGPRQ